MKTILTNEGPMAVGIYKHRLNNHKRWLKIIRIARKDYEKAIKNRTYELSSIKFLTGLCNWYALYVSENVYKPKRPSNLTACDLARVIEIVLGRQQRHGGYFFDCGALRPRAKLLRKAEKKLEQLIQLYEDQLTNYHAHTKN